MKGIVKLGDKLTSGGSVITASSSMIIEGIPAALVGDQVNCPIKGHGLNMITNSPSTYFEGNKAFALHNAICACGCSIIASSYQTVEKSSL